MNYIIKISLDADDAKDLYLRRFDSEDINAVRRALDDAIERKSRKKRSDNGTSRKTEGAVT